MPGSGMRMRSLGAAAGTEITGLDLATSLDERTFAEIEATFDRSGVIVVRDQRITPAELPPDELPPAELPPTALPTSEEPIRSTRPGKDASNDNQHQQRRRPLRRPTAHHR